MGGNGNGDSELFPLDYERLQKGSRVPEAEVRRIIGRVRDDRQFRLEFLKLRARVEKALLERGRPATICEDHGDLVVLTDVQASEYNHRQTGYGLRHAFRSNERLRRVDPNQLTEGQRALHEQRVLTDGRVLIAIARERKVIRAEERAKGLPEPKE